MSSASSQALERSRYFNQSAAGNVQDSYLAFEDIEPNARRSSAASLSPRQSPPREGYLEA
jgi:uncharacterized membrane protein